ncbi:hypothetical protein FGO68_gene9458 [Halteria grandinella]|uniref:Uncharacterized protein n=1 Tax=Halteria grandinella TaxID=5974 RepID=A0A8J8P1K1_HALGN|nr:hypothetical protein FGO68_gene9458 [Halteria grandinella]
MDEDSRKSAQGSFRSLDYIGIALSALGILRRARAGYILIYMWLPFRTVVNCSCYRFQQSVTCKIDQAKNWHFTMDLEEAMH